MLAPATRRMQSKMTMTSFRRNLQRKLFQKVSASQNVALTIVGTRENRIGDIDFDGNVQIDGHVEGDVRAKRIIIGNKALVDGTIVANSVHINGNVNGEIRSGLVSLGSNAVVKGNILYDVLKISAGASVWGLCRDRKRVDLSVADALHVDNVRPLPFSLVRSVRRNPKIIHDLSLRRNLRPAVRSMRAIWESHQEDGISEQS